MNMIRLYIRKKRKKGEMRKGKEDKKNRRGSNLASGHTTLEFEQK